MPNYKIFQDNADSARIKIYGDMDGTATPLSLDASGYLKVVGDMTLTSGDQVTVVNTSGHPLYVRPVSGASGAAWFIKQTGGDTFDVVQRSGVSGAAWFVKQTDGGTFDVVQRSGVSGAAWFVKQTDGGTFDVIQRSGVSGAAWFVKQTDGGTFDVVQRSGVSGAAWFVKQTDGDTFDVVQRSGVSGAAWFVKPTDAAEFKVKINSRATVDSGPVNFVASGDSTIVSSVWSVLGYESWTLAVKYQSGTSGASGLRLKLQSSAIEDGSGIDWHDEADYVDISSGAWDYFTTTQLLKYVRINCNNPVASGRGTIKLYFQAQE
ncbi:MAG: hypothetical protein ABFD08_08335 [Syntrophomonas sp.]